MSCLKHKKRNRSPTIISFQNVEKIRKEVGFTVIEISTLLGFSTRQYSRCRKKGEISAFRYYALKDALILSLIAESQEQIRKIAEL